MTIFEPKTENEQILIAIILALLRGRADKFVLAKRIVELGNQYRLGIEREGEAVHLHAHAIAGPLHGDN